MKNSILKEKLEDIKNYVHFEKSSAKVKQSTWDGTTQTTITSH